jgi:hypothetical protein
MIFRVSFERNFSVAIGAFEVEAEDLNAQICIFVADFHAHVELGSDVQIICAGVAPKTHWQHVAYHHELVFAPAAFYNAVVIEVFWEIFDEDLTLCHSIISYFSFKLCDTPYSIIVMWNNHCLGRGWNGVEAELWRVLENWQQWNNKIKNITSDVIPRSHHHLA